MVSIRFTDVRKLYRVGLGKKTAATNSHTTPGKSDISSSESVVPAAVWIEQIEPMINAAIVTECFCQSDYHHAVLNPHLERRQDQMSHSNNQYPIHCECGSVAGILSGSPRVRGHCHCEDCRDLLNVPFHSVTAWNPDQLTITQGEDVLKEYQHPHLDMKRIYCSRCGETLYNTNAMDWRVVSQHLIKKCSGGELADGLQAESHFFYDRRLFDIDDDLPKYD